MDTLRSGGYTTLNVSQAQLDLDTRKINLEQVDTSPLNDIYARIGEGMKIYLYDGYQGAIGRLAPAIGRGLESLPALTARKALAEQVHEGAVILARAYLDSEQPDKAELIARLVRTFPSREPDPKTAPQEVRDLFARARGELAREQTRLVLRPFAAPGRSGCVYYINGFEANASTSYVVSPDQDYVLQMSCARGSQPLAWRHSPDGGVKNEVPIIDAEPLEMDMLDGSFRSRAVVEQRILFALRWSRCATFVGVSKTGSTGPEAVLLSRTDQSEGQVIWSDRANRDSIESVVGSLFSGMQMPTSEAGAAPIIPERALATPPPDRGGAGAAPWLVTGLGVMAAGAGGAMWWIWEQEVDRLRCSELSSADKSGCAGVDAYEPGEVSAQEFQELSARAGRNRTIGVATLIGGGVLTGAGAVWLLVRDRPGSRADVLLAPTRGGAAAGGVPVVLNCFEFHHVLTLSLALLEGSRVRSISSPGAPECLARYLLHDSLYSPRSPSP